MSSLREEDDMQIHEAVSFVSDASIALSEAIHKILDARTDGAARLREEMIRIRDTLVKVHEYIDHADGILIDVGEHMRRCTHQEEAWSHEKFYSCNHCGAVWTGLRWSHDADATSKA